MISILRSLANFIEPVGLIWLVLSVMTVIPLRRRQWRVACLPGAAWLLLTLTAATPLSSTLLASLESPWSPVDLAQVPECDAIVVLGGGLEPSRHEPSGLHLGAGADRLFTGLLLARKEKGKLMVVSGGLFDTPTGTESEADAAKQWVESWQLSPIPVESLGGCTDTHDEAVKVAALAVKHGWKRVALVTSAYHMGRSKAVFEKAGNTVIPVPCNYHSAAMRGRKVQWMDVPNAANLAHFEAWMHEVLGWWAYRLRGWV
jgi:uncharacterized SAM-binding protein YcdF (DUF218 family)